MGEKKYSWIAEFGLPFFNPGDGFYLLKILNDSIHDGEKGIYDPGDFKLIDVFGDPESEVLSPGHDTLSKNFTIRRKPQYWKNDTLPGLEGSWAHSDDSTEWNCRQIQDYLDQGYTEIQAMAKLTENIGSHTFDPITEYLSTITSLYYRVSAGYSRDETIRGIVSGTRVGEFVDKLDQKDPEQKLEIIGQKGNIKQEADTLQNLDTLRVISANREDITQYVLYVSEDGFDSDVILTAVEGSGYTLNIEGDSGAISGIPVGTSLAEVLESITVPQEARLHVINKEDELVPLKRRNYSNNYVNTLATGNKYFEVRARDFVTQCTYQLIPEIENNEVYAFSDVYETDHETRLISVIPDSTNIETLLRHVSPNHGAGIKLVDKLGYEWTRGEVKSDDRLVVTSSDSSTQTSYYLNLLSESSENEAYAHSSFLDIDPVHKNITGIACGTRIQEFFNLIELPAGASMHLLNQAGNEFTGDTIYNALTLEVVSGNNQDTVYYDLMVFCEPLVTSSSYEINLDEQVISNIDEFTAIDTFLQNIELSPGASAEIINADSLVVSEGSLDPGYILKIISGDGSRIHYYELSVKVSIAAQKFGTKPIVVYPNPAKQLIYINVNRPFNKLSYRLATIRGQILITGTIPEYTGPYQIDVSNIPAGFYLLKVKNKEAEKTFKIMLRE